MLRITYDHQIFASQKFGGISRYFYELAKRVDKADGFAATVVAPFYKNSYLAEGNIKVNGIKTPNIPKTGRAVWAMNAFLAPLMVRASRPDLVHETYYQASSPEIKGCPSVITVLDMIHEKYPDVFSPMDSTANAKRLAVARADYIICISDNTRRDLIELLQVPPEKTRTIHLGFSLTAAGNQVQAVHSSKPYILYVGQRHGYKNFDALVQAYSSSKVLSSEFDLFAFGGGGFSSAERRKINTLGLAQASVRQMGGGDELLTSLYQNAAVFVYPSLYEGFGIPPLEAMSFGCPVVCANSSSIPEVVGDAAYLFDPLNIDEMISAMEAVVSDSKLREELIRRGYERIQHFSWDRCAEETMQVYREVVS